MADNIPTGASAEAAEDAAMTASLAAHLAGQGTDIDAITRPSTAVVNVSAPVLERTTSLGNLRRYDVVCTVMSSKRKAESNVVPDG